MTHHNAYLNYVLRHKWFVFLECVKLGIPLRGIVHDLSKFLPSEFFPYADHFHGKGKKDGIKTGRNKTGYYKPTDTGDPAFDKAWFHHQKRNDHHWQYWCQPDEDGSPVKVLEMPMECRLEMLADWRGAGRAQGTPDTLAWYTENGMKMSLGPYTRAWVEHVLGFTAYGTPCWISKSQWWTPKELDSIPFEKGEVNWADDFYFHVAYPFYVRRKMLREDPAFEMSLIDEALYSQLFWAINKMFLPDRWAPEEVGNGGMEKKFERAKAESRERLRKEGFDG